MQVLLLLLCFYFGLGFGFSWDWHELWPKKENDLYTNHDKNRTRHWIRMCLNSTSRTYVERNRHPMLR